MASCFAPLFLCKTPAWVRGSFPSQVALPSSAGESAGIDWPCLPRAAGLCATLLLPILPASEEAKSPCQRFKSFPQLEENSSYNSSHLYKASQLKKVFNRQYSFVPPATFQDLELSISSLEWRLGVAHPEPFPGPQGVPFHWKEDSEDILQGEMCSGVGTLPSTSPKPCPRCQPSS